MSPNEAAGKNIFLFDMSYPSKQFGSHRYGGGVSWRLQYLYNQLPVAVALTTKPFEYSLESPGCGSSVIDGQGGQGTVVVVVVTGIVVVVVVIGGHGGHGGHGTVVVVVVYGPLTQHGNSDT